jgi:ribosomal protein L21E
MRIKTAVLTLALCVSAVALGFAADSEMGTWKLNESKSKIAPGMPKNHTVTYEAAGDSVKITVDGSDKDGKATHNEWTGKFDGKDYPVTGDATSVKIHRQAKRKDHEYRSGCHFS